VQWCIEQRCKLLGHYAAAKADDQLRRRDEFRVAGKRPSEVNSEMLARLNERIEQRRLYESALAAADETSN